MPKNLTGNSSLFPTQTCPVAGEPRTSGSIETPLQNAADRTQCVYDRITFVDPTREGVRRLRRFASIADLKAATETPGGTVAIVDGVGIYQYDSASTAPELSPMCVKPTGVGTDPGAWLVAGVGSGMLNAPNGVAQLNGAGKVPTSLLADGDANGRIVAGAVRNGIANVQRVTFKGPHTTVMTSFQAIPETAFSVSMLAGDLLTIAGRAVARNDDGTSVAHSMEWQASPPAGGGVSLGAFTVVSSDAHQDAAIPIASAYQASAAGVHTFVLRHHGANGHAVAISDAFALATLMRP